MQDLSFIEKNVISPYKEMLAYETLWAIEGIKDNNLKRFFNNRMDSLFTYISYYIFKD